MWNNVDAAEVVINSKVVFIPRCEHKLRIYLPEKQQKTRYELIAAVVTRKDVYGGSADLQRHMMFTSCPGANQLQERERGGNEWGQTGK